MSNFSASSEYKFDKGLRLNANININGPNLSIQTTSNSFIGYSFTPNKELIRDKLSFSASANNPFNKYRFNNNFTNGSNFTQQSNNQSYLRNYSISLNYKFGKLKSSIKKNKKGINNNDVSSGSGNP